MVLLFEPDPDLAHLLRYLLVQAGYSVQTAATLETVAAMATERPALAVVDPGEVADGWALCQQVRQRTGHPVICLLPPNAPRGPETDLHTLSVPVSPRALRTLVQTLLTVLVTQI
jgi:CheY-like chemotaxis protein